MDGWMDGYIGGYHK